MVTRAGYDHHISKQLNIYHNIIFTYLKQAGYRETFDIWMLYDAE